MFKIISFLFCKLISQFQFVYTHSFRVSFAHYGFFFFYLLSFSVFLCLNFKGKSFISEIFIFYVFNEFSYGFVKRDTFSLSFFFVFDFDYSFYSSVWGFFWIVQVCVGHWLLCYKEFPFVIEFKDLFL